MTRKSATPARRRRRFQEARGAALRCTSLVQTRVPVALETFVRRRAQESGLSVSSWLRNLLTREKQRHGAPA